jgi:chromosomal replication initiation ATPase DnaA
MIDPQIIIERAAAAFGVTPEALIGPRRFARLAPPRQACAWALRQIGLTLMEIGEILHRDHTTIIASIARAEERAAEDDEYAQALRLLIARPQTIRAARPGPPVGVRTPRVYKLALTA